MAMKKVKRSNGTSVVLDSKTGRIVGNRGSDKARAGVSTPLQPKDILADLTTQAYEAKQAPTPPSGANSAAWHEREADRIRYAMTRTLNPFRLITRNMERKHLERAYGPIEWSV